MKSGTYKAGGARGKVVCAPCGKVSHRDPLCSMSGGVPATTSFKSSSLGLLYRWKVAKVLWPVMAMIRL